MTFLPTSDMISAEIHWRYGAPPGAAPAAPTRPARQIAALVRKRCRRG